MPVLTIKEMGGMLPAWGDRFLPEGQASFARNCYLYSGELNGWRQPSLLFELQNSTSKFAYRVPINSQSIANANLLFVSNPIDGDTVSIGDTTYTFRNTPLAAFDVLIGSGATQTCQNFYMTMQYGQQDVTVCGPGTSPADDVALGAEYCGYPFSNVPASIQVPGAVLTLALFRASGTQFLDSISFLPLSTNGATQVQGALYSNIDQILVGNTAYENQPGMLVAACAPVTGVTAGTPCVMPFTEPVTIIAGELYWLAFVTDTGVNVQQASTSATAARVSTILAKAITSGGIPPIQGTPIIGQLPTGGTGSSPPIIQPNSIINQLPTRNPGPDAGPPTNYVITPVTLPNPIIGQFAVANPVSYSNPTLQLWGTLSPIQSIDPVNTIGGAVINGITLPYVNVEATDYGAAFNTVEVGESTNQSRLSWTASLASSVGGLSQLVGGTNPTADTAIAAPSVWLEFSDPDTTVVRSPVVNDAFQRIYYASPSQPPQYNTALRVQNNQPPFLLGVPAPPLPPSLTIAGGGTITSVGLSTSTSISAAGSPGVYEFQPVASPQPYPPTPHTPQQGQEMPAPTQMEAAAGYGGSYGNQTGGQGAYFVLQSAVTGGALQLNDIAVSMLPPDPNSGVKNPFTGQAYPPAVPIFMGFLYADNNGYPGELLAMGIPSNAPITTLTTLGIESSSATLPGTIISFFSNPVQLSPNTKYWIGGFFATGQVVQLADDYDTAGTLYTTAADPTLFNNAVNVAGGFLPYSYATDPSQLTSLTPAPAGMLALGSDLQIWGDCINTAVLESRAYVYTWTTAYGEEGPPSPPVINDGYDNATWMVTMFPPIPKDEGPQRNITQANLYRTVTSTTGPTSYFLVDSFPVGQPTYVDNIPDNIVAQNIELPSETWFPPPGDLTSMISMPNGIVAGFKGNEVWFCEPYRPHAWPGGYVLTTEYPIVGLGVVGTTLVVVTESTPYIIEGVSPGAMISRKIMHPEPGLSRGSIVGSDTGVFYPSLNGLTKVTPDSKAAVITEGWITREKWAQLTPLKNIRAVKVMSAFMAYGTTAPGDNSVAQQGYTIELSETVDNESFGIYPQPGRHRIGFSTLNSPLQTVNVDNVFLDPWTGTVLYIMNGGVYQLDFADPLALTQPYLWRSKKFQAHHKDNYGAFRVWFDIPEGGPQTPPVTGTYAQPSYTTAINIQLQTGMFGVVRILADGRYVCERELRTSTQLMRIPTGFKASTWQVEFEARVPISNMKLANSVKELALDRESMR